MWPRGCAGSWLANNFRCDYQSNLFADDRVTGVHAEITTVDRSGRLEAHLLASASKFSVNLDIELDRLCDAEQGEIAGNMDKPHIGLLDGSGDEGNIGEIRGVEKRFALNAGEPISTESAATLNDTLLSGVL